MEIHAKSLCRTKPSPDLSSPQHYTTAKPASGLQKDHQAFSESNLTNFIPKNYTKPLQGVQI